MCLRDVGFSAIKNTSQMMSSGHLSEKFTGENKCKTMSLHLEMVESMSRLSERKEKTKRSFSILNLKRQGLFAPLVLCRPLGPRALTTCLHLTHSHQGSSAFFGHTFLQAFGFLAAWLPQSMLQCAALWRGAPGTCEFYWASKRLFL